MTEEQILSVIPLTEPDDFRTFCNSLGDDCPQERTEWAELFNTLRLLERQGDIMIDRLGRRIEFLQLTEQGANRIREFNDAKRPLLQLL